MLSLNTTIALPGREGIFLIERTIKIDNMNRLGGRNIFYDKFSRRPEKIDSATAASLHWFGKYSVNQNYIQVIRRTRSYIVHGEFNHKFSLLKFQQKYLGNIYNVGNLIQGLLTYNRKQLVSHLISFWFIMLTQWRNGASGDRFE